MVISSLNQEIIESANIYILCPSSSQSGAGGCINERPDLVDQSLRKIHHSRDGTILKLCDALYQYRYQAFHA